MRLIVTQPNEPMYIRMHTAFILVTKVYQLIYLYVKELIYQNVYQSAGTGFFYDL